MHIYSQCLLKSSSSAKPETGCLACSSRCFLLCFQVWLISLNYILFKELMCFRNVRNSCVVPNWRLTSLTVTAVLASNSELPWPNSCFMLHISVIYFCSAERIHLQKCSLLSSIRILLITWEKKKKSVHHRSDLAAVLDFLDLRLQLSFCLAMREMFFVLQPSPDKPLNPKQLNIL